jgi:hypothetical protein
MGMADGTLVHAFSIQLIFICRDFFLRTMTRNGQFPSTAQTIAIAKPSKRLQAISDSLLISFPLRFKCRGPLASEYPNESGGFRKVFFKSQQESFLLHLLKFLFSRHTPHTSSSLAFFYGLVRSAYILINSTQWGI